MIFVNVSPLLWDIIIFGIITGFFIGGRALTFISAGNLLSIGVMLAFRPLLINTFKNMVSPWFSEFTGTFAPFKNLLIDNIGLLIYVVIWVVSVNILFWIIYIILYFTIFKNIKIEHKAINATVGILINFIRMSILGGMLIIMMGSNIFGNKLLSYGVIKNEIPTNSVTHKVFSSIDNNLPFFNVNVVDINTIITLYQNDQTLRETISKLKTDTNYEQCNDTIEKLKMIITLRETENNKISDALDNMRMTGEVATNKKTILDNLNQHSNNDFLDVNYMVPIFNSYSNIINLYAEVVEIFDNNMKDMPVVATDTPENVDRYRALKPKIDVFTESIKDVTIRNHIIENLKKIYVPF
ncbi:hypothetical protein [Spiroplasma endosymbiont of Polydrusus pterygomalis]|uniref:hypothetical protein n=1 Tax=Spiroplasma endosymbiont of Polydrusus pterygomalis TaxID=3139327 RepID=UPI003CCAC1E6